MMICVTDAGPMGKFWADPHAAAGNLCAGFVAGPAGAELDSYTAAWAYVSCLYPLL